MKKVLVFSLLVVVAVCFAACGKKKNESSECKITSVTSSLEPMQAWASSGTYSWAAKFYKDDSSVSVTYVVSDKATASPASPQTMTPGGNDLTVTVTAEDGSKQAWTIKADKDGTTVRP